MDFAISRNGVKIGLTSERWFHIIENHDDMAGHYDDVLRAVEEPDYIVKGYRDALMALQQVKPGKFLVVVYKETGEDGFVITAHFTRKLKLEREEILWQKSR